jgi:hypothetical protein
MFRSIQIQLACQPCIENGKVAECTHMLHLVPRWQSSERHIRLKTIMQDRPDLIESELSGLAFDSLQNCFREKDVSIMFDQASLPPVFGEPIFIVVDPAAGGPQSDYAFISFTRNKGLVQVIPLSQALMYALRAFSTRSWTLYISLRCHLGTTSLANTVKNPGALWPHSGPIFAFGNPSHTQRFPITSTLSSSSSTALA